MVIVGVNAYHGDSSAALLIDGRLAAAAEEERFRRVKHWAGFPAEAVRYCLSEAGLGLRDVNLVAINQDSKANLARKIGYTLARRPELSLLLDRIRNKRERAGVGGELERAFQGQHFGGHLRSVEHHLAHLASAYLVSPFDAAVAVSVDGFGDFASGAWGVGRGGDISIDNKVYFPHSLGIFYQALTQYLGFPQYGDEYKVMGLAPYGEPRYLDAMRRLVAADDRGGYRLELSYFRHHREKVDYEWDNGAPVVGQLYSPALEELLGPARRTGEPLEQRHRDIARSVQAMYEEVFFHLLRHLHAQHGLEALALAGGCAMNSVANGKICRMTPFRRVYVQSAAGDAGGAIGAALVAYHETMGGGAERFPMDHAYWGPSYSDEQVALELDRVQSRLQQAGCSVACLSDRGELCRQTAQAIADGAVVGWFQGRMEWGPRALGNRSIVCDPRRADMKDVLNRKIKRRESFRPFAPSILREAVPDWFEQDDDVPFMMKVFPIREERRRMIPAVVHVDGSGRLQTVQQSTNPLYYRLIECFRELTGVPMVLNTSFNENEPVVCRPAEALECFLRTQMDMLVLGSYVIRRGVVPDGKMASQENEVRLTEYHDSR